ncbi:MAG: hypothetical protein ACLSWR_02350, partial [Ruthenibacterium sp.]
DDAMRPNFCFRGNVFLRQRAFRGRFFGVTGFPRILCKLFRLLSNFIHILPVISELPQGHIT